ncbi:hypothetical protein GCM10010123_19270 [Pilimelia anulata]|uniref:Uncharacterized protein n=1 Tax=Pilimelia anulata TaxID=53371 RepID=A0A8J3FC40_9ACTN|nr:hypothetical protein GCM10010123_19270 [Pilimelia anulata]
MSSSPATATMVTPSLVGSLKRRSLDGMHTHPGPDPRVTSDGSLSLEPVEVDVPIRVAFNQCGPSSRSGSLSRGGPNAVDRL